MPDLSPGVDTNLPPLFIRRNSRQAQRYSPPQRRGIPVMVVRQCARRIIQREEPPRVSLSLLPSPLHQRPDMVGSRRTRRPTGFTLRSDGHGPTARVTVQTIHRIRPNPSNPWATDFPQARPTRIRIGSL